MPYLDSHRSYFLDRQPTQLESIRVADVIEFAYDGSLRYAVVMNPDWKEKIHAIDLNLVSHIQLVTMLLQMPKMSPLQFYYTYYNKQSTLIKLDMYRTFNKNKIVQLSYIPYDLYGIRKSSKDSIIWTRPRLNTYRYIIRRREQREEFEKDIIMSALHKTASTMTPLTENMWRALEDTISYTAVRKGDVNSALRAGVLRGWPLAAVNNKLNLFLRGGRVEAPTVINRGGRLQVVTGELSLIFARALDITPTVAIGEVE